MFRWFALRLVVAVITRSSAHITQAAMCASPRQDRIARGDSGCRDVVIGKTFDDGFTLKHLGGGKVMWADLPDDGFTQF